MERRKDLEGKVIVENVPIRMVVTYNSQRIIFYAGCRTDAKKWDESKERVKANTTNSKGEISSTINSRINTLETGINEYFKVCEVKRIMPAVNDVKQAFANLFNEAKQNSTSIFHIFDEFVKKSGSENDWSESAYKKFATIKNHLESFDKQLSFESFNTDKLAKLIEYLRNKKGLRNTTIDKNLKFIKWFLRWANKQGCPVNNFALQYKPLLKGVDGKIKKVIFLTREELMHLYNLEIADFKGYLQRVRDVFCFCCFSGLRYSDVFNLKKSNDKGSYIEFVTQKTHETLVVQFNKYSRAILDKYKAVPVISNQKMNEFLKELGELAWLRELYCDRFKQKVQEHIDATGWEPLKHKPLPYFPN